MSEGFRADVGRIFGRIVGKTKPTDALSQHFYSSRRASHPSSFQSSISKF